MRGGRERERGEKSERLALTRESSLVLKSDIGEEVESHYDNIFFAIYWMYWMRCTGYCYLDDCISDLFDHGYSHRMKELA